MSVPKLAGFPKENDGDGRYYTHPRTGERLPSVTSVLKLVRKDLEQYAADGMLLWAVDHLDELYQRSPERGFKSNRFRWKDRGDERAQLGTGVHETIEALHTGSWNFPVLDDEQQQIMEQWRLLNTEHEIVPILSEFTCWNTGISAGTADGYWIIDGVNTLVDIKTSKKMWDEHNYQLAALWKSPKIMREIKNDEWVELDAPKYDKVAIVHLRSDTRGIHYIDDLELNYQAFKGYADVWKAKQAIALEHKKREAAKYGGF